MRLLAQAGANRIEQRLDPRADRGAMQRELVSQIYKLRFDVETVYMVLQHAAVTTPARPF